jgi:hypothetical protein
MAEQYDRLPEYLEELERGKPLASLLTTIPESETEVRSLLALAATVRTVAHPSLSTASAPLAHHKLLTAFARRDQTVPPARWRFWLWRPSFASPMMAGAALLLIVIVGLWAFSARIGWLNGIVARWQAATPVTTGQPSAASLVFEPTLLTFAGCENEYLLSATLINNAASDGQALRNVELGYTISQGATYLQRVALEPSGWEELAVGERVSVAAQVVLTPAWVNVAEGGTVRLRLFALPQEGGLAATPSATLDVILRHQCEVRATPVASPLATPTAYTVRPNLPPQANRAEDEQGDQDTERDFCADETWQHPVAMQLASQFEVPYSTIAEWFCQGYSFGEIQLVYELSRESGASVDEIFALRDAGYGWGQIMIQLGVRLRTGPSTVPLEEGDEEP